MLATLAGFLGLYLLLMYGIIPIAMRNKLAQASDYSLYCYDPYERPPHPNVLAKIREAYDQLAPHGFEPHAYLFQENMMAGAAAYVTVLIHPDRRIVASITTLQVTNQTTGNTVSYVTVASSYGADDHVGINNCKTLQGTFAIRPGVRIWQAPWLTSPVELLRSHDLLAAEFKPNAQRILDIDKDPVEDQRESNRRELDYQVQCGYFKYDTDSRMYIPTVWGAYLMIWKNLWPVSMFRRWVQHGRTRKLMKLLDQKHGGVSVG